MKSTHHKAALIPGLFASPGPRLHAEWPALTDEPALAALHDFLVPNLRPDLSCDDDPFAPPARRASRHDFEFDSIFWNPESDAGDAA